jgi:hypothetical protein
MATAATATTTAKHRHRFPRKMGRFINLEGGLYGTLDLVAITDRLLEFQTGEDFIRFDRDQAANLRDTIEKFLAFEHHQGEPELTEEVATVVVEEQREDFARAKRPRSRRKSERKSERRA